MAKAMPAKIWLIPMQQVDRAVNYIQRWGTSAERKALSEAIALLEEEGKARQRAAIMAVSQKVKGRRAQEPKRTSFNSHKFIDNQYVPDTKS